MRELKVYLKCFVAVNISFLVFYVLCSFCLLDAAWIIQEGTAANIVRTIGVFFSITLSVYIVLLYESRND